MNIKIYRESKLDYKAMYSYRAKQFIRASIDTTITTIDTIFVEHRLPS
jgi:hypothetical protein